MFCREDSGQRYDGQAQVSYWYKLANDKAWYGVECDSPRRAMSEYCYKPDQIAFCEPASRHWGRTNGTLDNGMQANAAFMDVHVETIVLRNGTSGDTFGCGEPMYYNCDARTGKCNRQPARYVDPTKYKDCF